MDEKEITNEPSIDAAIAASRFQTSMQREKEGLT